MPFLSCSPSKISLFLFFQSVWSDLLLLLPVCSRLCRNQHVSYNSQRELLSGKLENLFAMLKMISTDGIENVEMMFDVELDINRHL